MKDLPEKVRLGLPRIQLLVMDVDGTLTDGGMYYGPTGEELKRFFVRDGMGIVRLPGHGIQTCFMTSENSPLISTRAERLKIGHLIMGTKTKKRDLIDLAARLELPLSAIAYIGDDINDEHAMAAAGLSFCPNDAHPLIQSRADCIIPLPGGNGAVRLLCDLLLQARNVSLSFEEN